MNTIIVNNLSETQKLAQKFAKLLTGGEIILLNGDLGAGKTTFTRFLLQSLGVKDTISSPTFTLMKEYKSKKFNIYHFDMYRINSSAEVSEFGLDDYIYGTNTNALVFIEWSEKIKDILPKKTIEIDISIIDQDKRKFDIRR